MYLFQLVVLCKYVKLINRDYQCKMFWFPITHKFAETRILSLAL